MQNFLTTLPTIIVQFFQELYDMISSLTVPDLSSTRRFRDVRQLLADLKTLAKIHDPFKAAREDALNPQGNHESHRGNYEHRLAMSVANQLERLKRDAEHLMRNLQFRINRIPRISVPNEDEVAADVKAQQSGLYRDWRPRLIDSRISVLRNKRSLNVFRRINNIVRDTAMPKVILAILSIFATGTLEFYTNFHFLSGTGALSPVNTLAFVGSTAAINVVLGNLTGLGGKNLYHVRWYRKLLGILVFIVGLAIALGLHGGLAMYRQAIDAALSDPDSQNDPAVVLQKFHNASAELYSGNANSLWPVLNDINAVIVFALGCLFFWISVLEGIFLWSDPYPGLGQHQGAYDRAHKTSDKIRQKFREATNGIVLAACLSLDELARQGGKRLQTVKVSINDAIGLARQYEVEATKLEDTLRRMIADYRAEYQHMREVKGPQYWKDDDAPSLDRGSSFTLDHFIQTQEVEGNNHHALVDLVETIKGHLAADQATMLTRIDDYLDAIENDAVEEDKRTSAEFVAELKNAID